MTFKIETATVTANNERSLKEDWTIEAEVGHYIFHIDGDGDLQLKTNGFIAYYGEGVEEGLMNSLTEEILKDEE